MTHCRGLMSLYGVENETEGAEDESLKMTDSANDVYAILGGNTTKKDRFKCLSSLWYCNNGISPKNQMKLLKVAFQKHECSMDKAKRDSSTFSTPGDV